MGFVSSASSVYLDVQLTNYGRGVVLSGDLKTRISKFGLSDSDIDYRLPISTGHTTASQGGLIPDVSGNHVNCASGVNDGFKCSSNIHQSLTAIDKGKQNVQVVVGIDKDLTGNKTYYSDVDVEVYVHDYYALCKVLSHVYAEDHKLLYGSLNGGASSTYTEFNKTFLTSFSSNSSIAAGVWDSQTIKSALELLNNRGRGQFIDFWDCVNVNYPNLGRVEENISITSSEQIYMNNAAAVTGRLSLRGLGPGYNTVQKTYDTGLQTLPGNTIGVSTSPFTLAFSSGEKSTKKGAGAAGIGFTTTEFGYLVLGGGANWGSSSSSNSGYKYYPSVFPDYSVDINYDKTKYFLGFVQPVEFENAPELDFNITSQGGAQINIKGYDQQDTQTNETYSQVKTVLPTLKYAITKPPISPSLDPQTSDQIDKMSNLYEQSYDNSNAGRYYSNFYYPIKQNRADEIKELIQTGMNSLVPQYHQSTFTDHPTDTFALLGTNFEYTNGTKGTNKIGVGGNTVPSVEKLFTINSSDVKNGKHYYNWFGRMMIEGDYFFRAVGDNYNNGNTTFKTHVSQFSARTGTANSADGIDDFNIKIPMEFKIYSDENSDALPATCKVTLVYNKRAAKQSIGYSGFSDFATGDPHVPYWRVYDRTIPTGASTYNDRKPRFYGENGETINAYTSDPTDVTTAGNATTGKRIFRKVLAGGTVIE